MPFGKNLPTEALKGKFISRSTLENLVRFLVDPALTRQGLDQWLEDEAGSAVLEGGAGKWHVPESPPFFVGQKELIATIGEALKAGKIPVLTGFGGMGKTALAQHYAHSRRSDFHDGFFFLADTPQQLWNEVLDRAEIRLPADAPTEERKRLALEQLRTIAADPNNLVILDNLDGMLPAHEGELREVIAILKSAKVIATIRPNRSVSWGEVIPVDSLSDQEGALLFFRLCRRKADAAWADTPENERESCLAVSRLLGGMPLALEQAGRLAAEQGLSPAIMLEQLRKQRSLVAAVLQKQPEEHRQEPLWLTVSLALEGLTEAQRELMFVLSWLDPDHLDERFFTKWGMKLPAVLDEHRGDWFAFTGPLIERALVSRVEEVDPMSVDRNPRTRLVVHRAVQEVIRALDDPRWLEGCEVGNWAALTSLEQARYREGESHVRVGLGDERLAQIGVPLFSALLNNLAQLLQATSRLSEAEPLMRRVIEILELSLGPDHPNVATSLNNLALLLQDTNRLREAEPLMRRALAIDEQSFGPDHPNVAIRLNNLAQLLKATNRLSEAVPLMRRALAIDEQSLGPDHPEVATDLNNLAQLLQDTNRLSEAEPLMRRALEVFERSLGPDHPNVATSVNNLASLLWATNRLSEAEPLMRRVIEIFERSLGPDHPNVATSLNNLASLLQATNRLGEAEPLMRRMVAIFARFNLGTGHQHPHFWAAVGNYEALLTEMGKSEEECGREIVNTLVEAGYTPEQLRNLFESQQVQ